MASSEVITKNDLTAILNELLPVMYIHKIHVSTSNPTSSDGNDGDIWIKYTASA